MTASPIPAQSGERGMILINVLVIVMLATAVLAFMLASEDSQTQRSAHLRSASEALAIARGGEMSAIVALRRDLAHDLATNNESDTLAEPWAHIADTDTRVTGGKFSFVVADAQARFNINNLAHGDTSALGALNALAANAGIEPAGVAAILTWLTRHGTIRDLSDLREAGLTEAQVQRLSDLCVALPLPTKVNVNTAPEALLAIMAGDPGTAHTLVLAREKSGIAANAPIALPPGTGVSSDYYWSRARVTNGGTSQQLTTLLHRHQDNGRPVVTAVARWRGAAPLAAPAFQ